MHVGGSMIIDTTFSMKFNVPEKYIQDNNNRRFIEPEQNMTMACEGTFSRSSKTFSLW